MRRENIEDIVRDENALKSHIESLLCNRQRRLIPKDNLRESAVLIPVCFEDGHPWVIVTKRSMTVEHHRGEISFPGGRAEPGDKDLVFTALREAEEEIGLKKDDVEVLGLLDDHISILGYHITPVVGAIPSPYRFTINSESEVLLRVSLISALKDTVWMAEKTTFMGRDINIYYLEIDGGILWGASARMFKHFVDLIAGRTVCYGPVSPKAKAWVRELLGRQAGHASGR
ncbi:MAG: putative NUDIX hydrolase [Deltaproteobacteria bacterium ADurb.BinA179]|nr:CoA pyrophosphatase [Deltaproteobacteria bacterium]MDI9543410.1 CoA pyrophosphatase [Pseudomonadota bacterium]OPZ30216.1 MAG: putative NUDIX hydrolase [Deltaproteobacteria bacterium ADurb.BinA179]HOD71552.1 CoA pyrophosphatase [Deltaproteobacteria bacterium]HPA83869.1 CoA pyrophosphatase [Deltaproteobacteria bacterium]